MLAYLEAKRLITVAKEGSSYRIALTDLGRERAKLLAAAILRSARRAHAADQEDVRK